jgi:hypothetical protein
MAFPFYSGTLQVLSPVFVTSLFLAHTEKNSNAYFYACKLTSHHHVHMNLLDAQMKFFAVVIYTPFFFFPGSYSLISPGFLLVLIFLSGLLVGAVGGWVGQIYITAQLPVKRVMSNTRAPVLAQYVSTVICAWLLRIVLVSASEQR